MAVISKNLENLSGTTERFFAIPAGIQCKILADVPEDRPPSGDVWVYLRDGLWRALNSSGVETPLGGEPGPPGPPGEELFKNEEFAFDFQTALSTLLVSVGVGMRVKLITIVIDVPFDDPDTFLSVGHTGNMNGLLARTDNDPTTAAQYVVEPNLLYGGDDEIYFYINAYNSTQGSGSVLIELVQN